MKPVDRYIHDVMACVFAAPAERARFEEDLRAHFADAEARGESPARIIEDMGRPGDVAAAFNAEREIRHASFWQRLVAFAGDAGVMLALCLAPLGLVLRVVGPLQPDETPSAGGLVVLAVAGCAVLGVMLLYFPLLEWRFGKTFGKHLLRIRVVDEAGGPISLGQAWLRRLSYYFEMLVVDALFIPFTDKRQRALDIVAKTIVACEPGEKARWWSWAVCLTLPAACLLAMLAIAVILPPG